MTVAPGFVRRFLLLGLLTGCAHPALSVRNSPPRSDAVVAEHAAGREFAWVPLDIEPIAGEKSQLDQVLVGSGETVRLETATPIEVREQIKSGVAAVEVARIVKPTSGVAFVQVAPTALALRFRRGAVTRAFVGRGSDPGYLWFENEARVVEWSEAPFGTPFPEVAPKQRIDAESFARLDNILKAAVAGARDAEVARAAAAGIRRVVALRTVRALRPAAGFPYFLDEAPELTSPPKLGRSAPLDDVYLVESGGAVEIRASGPKLLHVWSSGIPGEQDASVRVTVKEGSHIRALGGGAVPRRFAGDAAGISAVAASTNEKDGPALEFNALGTPLRRAIAHVPPGDHRYTIHVSGGSAYLRMLLARPVVHAEHALTGLKDEDALLAPALAMCGAGREPAMCAIAMTLLGEDETRDPRTRARYESLRNRLSPEQLGVLDLLAQGGPHDPTLALELDGSDGDVGAISRLVTWSNQSPDDVLRAARARAFVRGTRWSTVPDPTARPEPGERSPVDAWYSVNGIDSSRKECASAAGTVWTKLSREAAELRSESWFGVPTLTLVAAAPCAQSRPLELVVDGQALQAQPSSSAELLHVLVRRSTATVSRVDHSAGDLYALNATAVACGARWERMSPPRDPSVSPRLDFGADALGLGLELWLPEDAGESGKLEVTAADTTIHESLTITAVPEPARQLALDQTGRRWLRAGRILLPDWARGGVLLHTSNQLRVRALFRVSRALFDVRKLTSFEASLRRERGELLSQADVRQLSREILREPAAARRAELHLQRALSLARAGAERGAVEDALAAARLAGPGSGTRNALSLVLRSLQQAPATPFTLSPDTPAYGIEPAFEAEARRCGAALGVRGRLAKVIERVSAPDFGESNAWDPELGLEAFRATQSSPVDPRQKWVLDRAWLGSFWRWHLPQAWLPLKVPAKRDAASDEAVDAVGELEPRLLTGDPFEPGYFATVTNRRQTKAVFEGAAGASARLDVVCAAKSPAMALGERCPLVVQVGSTAPVKLLAGMDGRMSYSVPSAALRGGVEQLALSIPETPARWAALAQIVFNRRVPGSTQVDGRGWVIGSSSSRGRVLVPAERSLSTTLGRGLFRLDAQPAEGASDGRLYLSLAGKRREVQTDGSAVIFALERPTSIELHAGGSAVTVSLAERVGAEAPPAELARALVEASSPAVARGPTETIDFNQTARQDWLRSTADSRPPLQPLAEALGTFVARATGFQSSLRQGEAAGEVADAYLGTSIGYRRRLESIGLWTSADVLSRQRRGQPTFGIDAMLYEETPSRLRFLAAAGYFTQSVAGTAARTIRPRAFVEYSLSVASDLFLLPRLGYDGYYTSIAALPRSTPAVDDDVYSSFRFRRPSELYGQALLWWVPNFNDVFYLRGRATSELSSRRLGQTALRPGIFLAWKQIDFGSYLDVSWYAPLPGIQNAWSAHAVAGASAAYYGWLLPGSFLIMPGVSGRARVDAPGWEALATVAVLASFQRGLRDFSSPELDFPEQLGGGVPWRGDKKGTHP